MFQHVCAWCWYTRGRFERTHGDVLSGHTGLFSVSHTTHHTAHTPHHNNTTTTPHGDRDRGRQRKKTETVTEREEKIHFQCGGAWPFLVDVVFCLVHPVNGQVRLCFDFFQCILAGLTVLISAVYFIYAVTVVNFLNRLLMHLQFRFFQNYSVVQLQFLFFRNYFCISFLWKGYLPFNNHLFYCLSRARRGGKHALQHAPRTAMWKGKLSPHSQMGLLSKV